MPAELERIFEISRGTLLAQASGEPTGQELFLLGDDFMPWMVLAFGAAMVAGNVMALVRPPKDPDRSSPQRARAAARTAPAPRPPLARSLVMIVIGLVAAGWGLASLLS